MNLKMRIKYFNALTLTIAILASCLADELRRYFARSI